MVSSNIDSCKPILRTCRGIHSQFRRAQRLPWTIFVGCLLCLAASRAYGQTPQPGDLIWEVGTRHLASHAIIDCDFDFQVRKFENCGWRSSTLNDCIGAVAANQPTHVVIYVHGNWMEWGNARQRALDLYRKLSGVTREPICFIAYSWPSEKEYFFIKDIARKKNRLEMESRYLAGLLRRLPPENQLGLIGFSFGAPIVCGALHLNAGGSLSCRPSCEPVENYRCVNLSLMASAFDRTALGANGKYCRALDRVESVVNLYNSSDPILRRFRFFDRASDPIAAGFRGLEDPRGTQPLEANAKLVQFDCRGAIGRTHSEMAYYTECGAFRHVLKNALGQFSPQ